MKILCTFLFSSLLLLLHSMVCPQVLAYERNVLAAGWYNCLFIDKNGLVWGWGSGSELGLASDQATPQIVFEKAVSVSASHCSIASGEDGTVWGRGSNIFCQLGNNPFNESPRRIFYDAIALGVGPNAVNTFVIKPTSSIAVGRAIG